MLARPRRRWLGLTVMAETCALRQISLTPTFTASSRSSPGPFGALSSAREAQDSLPLVLLTLSLAHHCAASSSASSTRQVAAAPQRVNAPYPINPPPSPAPPAFLGPPALSTTLPEPSAPPPPLPSSKHSREEISPVAHVAQVIAYAVRLCPGIEVDCVKVEEVGRGEGAEEGHGANTACGELGVGWRAAAVLNVLAECRLGGCRRWPKARGGKEQERRRARVPLPPAFHPSTTQQHSRASF